MKYVYFFRTVLYVTTLSAVLSVIPKTAQSQSRFKSETFVATASTSSYYVSPSGNDNTGDGTSSNPWATVGEAIKQSYQTDSNGGFEILVAPGDYPALGYITQRFKNPVLVRAQTPYRSTLNKVNITSHRAGYLFQAKNIIIAGFEIVGYQDWRSLPEPEVGRNAYVFQIDMSERIILENNILHDSYNNDILKLNNYSDSCEVRGNIFYNQENAGGHQHIDVNVVYNTLIEDNIFFNNYEASGRNEPSMSSSSYIVVKSSGVADADADGQSKASRNIVFNRNVFYNWRGLPDQSFLLLGEDGKPFFEANDVLVENNLFISNTINRMSGAWSLKGVSNVVFRANTLSGFMQHSWDKDNNVTDGYFGYVVRVEESNANRGNQNVTIANNIFTDPSGRMAYLSGGGKTYLPSGSLVNNLYFNNGVTIKDASNNAFTISMDAAQIIADPLLEKDLSNVPFPVLLTNGTLQGGYQSIEDARIDLVNKYGTISSASPAVGAAAVAQMPERDILYNFRGTSKDVGAFEFNTGDLSVWDNPVTENENGLLIYPNPVVSDLTLQICGIDRNEAINVRIYTVTGSLVSEQHLDTDKHTISVSTLPQGVYMLKLTDKNGVSILKAVRFIKL
ncbi:MAG: T9SS type A sorting domain-containing protein [Bacteroidales bacterium]|nr:T9SS type A sorting domain-containing protein [Bacteroidales bacterium]